MLGAISEDFEKNMDIMARSENGRAGLGAGWVGGGGVGVGWGGGGGGGVLLPVLHVTTAVP